MDIMLQQGVNEPVQSKRSSFFVIVLKPDGSWWICIDYFRLITITIWDTYHIPWVDDCVDSLSEKTWISTIEANLGYCQVPISEENRDKTTFICQSGTYRFRRIPFGLSNTLATFKRMLDILLSVLNCRTYLIYLDDDIVFSRLFNDHLKDLGMVLSTLCEVRVSLI